MPFFHAHNLIEEIKKYKKVEGESAAIPSETMESGELLGEIEWKKVLSKAVVMVFIGFPLVFLYFLMIGPPEPKFDMFIKFGFPEKAVKGADKELARKPKYLSMYVIKAKALCKMEKYEQALQCADEALRIEPENFTGYFFRGNSLVGLGRYKEAISAYDQALKIIPESKRALKGRKEAQRLLQEDKKLPEK